MRIFSGVLVLSVLLLASCQDSPTVASAAPSFGVRGESRASVNGHVEKVLFGGYAFEKYSFSAHFSGNGSVVGQFVLSDVLGDGSETIRVRGEVRCFTVQSDGKTARMGGVVTWPSDFAGLEAAWTVKDNGEGANAPSDKATDLRIAIPQGEALLHCLYGFPVAAFGTWGDNLRANVQVRPE